MVWWKRDPQTFKIQKSLDQLRGIPSPLLNRCPKASELNPSDGCLHLCQSTVGSKRFMQPPES